MKRVNGLTVFFIMCGALGFFGESVLAKTGGNVGDGITSCGDPNPKGKNSFKLVGTVSMLAFNGADDPQLNPDVDVMVRLAPASGNQPPHFFRLFLPAQDIFALDNAERICRIINPDDTESFDPETMMEIPADPIIHAAVTTFLEEVRVAFDLGVVNGVPTGNIEFKIIEKLDGDDSQSIFNDEDEEALQTIPDNPTHGGSIGDFIVYAIVP